MDLINKVAYITGGTKGIGYGVAKVLTEAGMRVAISGRNEEEIKAAAISLGDDSKIIGIRSDVTKFEDEQNAIQQIKAHFGRLDLMLANAGIGVFCAVDEMTIDDWDKMMKTNLYGVFHSLKAAVSELKKSEGYYITLASLAGTNFFEKGTGYNATKFGVVGFTQAAMLDLRKYNIKVSTIMPGSVATCFNNHVPDENDFWKIQPEDIGKLVLDLLSMNPRTLPSKIEVRPTRPDLK